MFWSLLLILWNLIFFFSPIESCSVLFLISGNFLLGLWNLLKWFVIIYDAQIHIGGIVQWGTLTLHIRMPSITQIINDLQRAASNHSGSICSKYFTIDLTVIKEVAIIDQTSQLS